MAQEIIDQDGDQLDDRLVSVVDDAEDLDFYSLLNRVENVRIVGLPSEILEKMHQDITYEQDIIKGKLAKLETILHANLVKGNASFYEEARKDCRKYSKMYEDLEDYRKVIYDARQEKIVREGVSGYLGNTFANAIEGTIMVMIIAILSLMSYDIIYLDPVKDAELKTQIFWTDFIFCIVTPFAPINTPILCFDIWIVSFRSFFFALVACSIGVEYFEIVMVSDSTERDDG